MSDEKPTSSASGADPLDRVRAMIHFTPQAKAIGMEVTRIAPARVWGFVPYRDELIGDPETGVIAGGVITTFLGPPPAVICHSEFPPAEDAAVCREQSTQ